MEFVMMRCALKLLTGEYICLGRNNAQRLINLVDEAGPDRVGGIRVNDHYIQINAHHHTPPAPM